MGRGGDRDRQAALHRHATGEAHQLDRDLALVVVHGDDRVEGTGIALDLEENRVAWIRPFRRNPQRLSRAHGRADNVQFFAAERTVIAVMRVQPTHADARFFQAVALERGVDQLNCFDHPLFTEQPRHILQGHMGCHP
ncbi:hypothetical protein D3C76_1464690 [compost metagenome]